MADFQGSRLRFEGRAPSTISTAYVARWEGPVLERDDPYPHPGASREGLRAVRHVQEVLFLPPHSEPARQRGDQVGGDDVRRRGRHDGLRAQAASTPPRAPTTRAARDLDHHVCIVGWNDAYPAGRFLRRPPGPGAFLIKNSWGTSYGQGGYFWISYYDRSFGTTLAVFDGVEGAANHDAIYQHDALGWSKSIGYQSTTAWFAARYTSGGDGSVTAVSLYTAKPGATYEVRVAPALGRRRGGAGGRQRHTRRRRLSHRRPDHPGGGDGRRRLRRRRPPDDAGLPCAHPRRAPDQAAGTPRRLLGGPSSAATARRGQDLRTKPGFANSDVCLKAFVDSAGAGDSAAPRVRLEPATARCSAGARIRFTLTDPAFSSGSAVVKLWLRDASGRVLRQLRDPRRRR